MHGQFWYSERQSRSKCRTFVIRPRRLGNHFHSLCWQAACVLHNIPNCPTCNITAPGWATATDKTNPPLVTKHHILWHKADPSTTLHHKNHCSALCTCSHDGCQKAEAGQRGSDTSNKVGSVCSGGRGRDSAATSPSLETCPRVGV